MLARQVEQAPGVRVSRSIKSVSSAACVVAVLLVGTGSAQAHPVVTKPTYQVTSRVSVTSAGAQVAWGHSPKVTPDGRYVVLAMVAPSITGAGSQPQIFRRDQLTGNVVLVSADHTAGSVPD